MPFLSSAPDDREGARPTLIIQFILMETSDVGLGRDLSYSYVRTTYVYTHAYQVRETFSLFFFFLLPLALHCLQRARATRERVRDQR